MMHSSETLSFLQHQIDLIAVPVFVADEGKDSKFSFVAVNTLYARLWGLSKEQVIGRDPVETCTDPVMASAITGKYRMCLARDEPGCFRDRIANGETVAVVDTTLQKIALRHTGARRIVGTALEVGDRASLSGDMGFYMGLARNSLTTIEMLMKLGMEKTALTTSERQATEMLARNALAALDDADRAAARLARSEVSPDDGMAGAIRRVLLH